MFGLSCGSACSPKDPATSTVKVNLGGIQQQDLESKRQEDLQRQRLAEEVAARQKTQEEALARQKAEQEERHRTKEQEKARQEAEERARRERQQKEQQDRDAQRRAEEAAAKARQEEQERVEREEREKLVSAFLKQHGFAGVQSVKKSLLSGSTYPLHKAAELGDVKLVEMLIKSGADPTIKNSAGKTAGEVAQKKDKKGSHAPVISLLARPTVGGAGGA